MANVKRAFSLEHFGGGLYDFKDKANTVDNYIRMMLNRVQKMFKYENLPKTIKKDFFETYLLMGGWSYVTEVEGKPYAFRGGLGGVLDEYYFPTQVVISNPYLKFYKTLDIEKDGVLVKNDSMYLGLYDLFNKYATLLTESEITLRMSNINSRALTMISAPDDKTEKSARKYLEDLESGTIGVIAENTFLEGVKSHNIQNAGANITQNIEYHQYLKASFFNELGLNANYNMKREAINGEEAGMNEDALKPLIDDMFYCRQQGVEEINKKYGTNIKVSLDSTWALYDEEVDEVETDRDMAGLDDSGDISENNPEPGTTVAE